ncbi:MAG: riboflavin synthase [Caulobacteraceae bacterium]
MFTGIIEEVGTIRGVTRGERSGRLAIGCSYVLEDTAVGDSISVNGVCLTVTSLSEKNFEADVMPETMRATNLKYLKPGDSVNLERALSPVRRLGGHIVSGHIDGLGRISEIKKEDNAVWFTIEADRGILKYIIHKGSIAVDGISLTVQQVDERSFKIAVIPHTGDYTTLPARKVGYQANLECDIIGKYVEKLTAWEKRRDKNSITMEYLIENGF